MTLGEARMMLAIQASSADIDDLIDFHETIFGKTPEDPESERDRISDSCAELPVEKVIAVWNRIGYEQVYLAPDGEIRAVPTPEPVKAPTRLWRVWIGPRHCVVMAGSEDEAVRKYWARSAPAEPSDITVMAMVKEIILKDGVETTIYGV